MTTVWAYIIAFGMQIAPVTCGNVPYPPAAVVGGTVVTVLDVRNGSVDSAEVLHGDEPFLAPARQALLSWVFEPSANKKLLAVTVFRTPHFFSQGPGRWNLEMEVQRPGIPAPSVLSEPAYPANAAGNGTVALQLKIDRLGKVAEAAVLKPLGALTRPCVDAALSWQFRPARAADGRATDSDVLAICVYRAPLTANPRE